MLDKGVIDSVVKTGGKIPNKNPFLKKVVKRSPKDESELTFVPDLPAIREHLRKQRSEKKQESKSDPEPKGLQDTIKKLRRRDSANAAKAKQALVNANRAKAVATKNFDRVKKLNESVTDLVGIDVEVKGEISDLVDDTDTIKGDITDLVTRLEIEEAASNLFRDDISSLTMRLGIEEASTADINTELQDLDDHEARIHILEETDLTSIPEFIAFMVGANQRLTDIEQELQGVSDDTDNLLLRVADAENKALAEGIKLGHVIGTLGHGPDGMYLPHGGNLASAGSIREATQALDNANELVKADLKSSKLELRGHAKGLVEMLKTDTDQKFSDAEMALMTAEVELNMRIDVLAASTSNGVIWRGSCVFAELIAAADNSESPLQIGTTCLAKSPSGVDDCVLMYVGGMLGDDLSHLGQGEFGDRRDFVCMPLPSNVAAGVEVLKVEITSELGQVDNKIDQLEQDGATALQAHIDVTDASVQRLEEEIVKSEQRAVAHADGKVGDLQVVVNDVNSAFGNEKTKTHEERRVLTEGVSQLDVDNNKLNTLAGYGIMRAWDHPSGSMGGSNTIRQALTHFDAEVTSAHSKVDQEVLDRQAGNSNIINQADGDRMKTRSTLGVEEGFPIDSKGRNIATALSQIDTEVSGIGGRLTGAEGQLAVTKGKTEALETLAQDVNLVGLPGALAQADSRLTGLDNLLSTETKERRAVDESLTMIGQNTSASISELRGLVIAGVYDVSSLQTATEFFGMKDTYTVGQRVFVRDLDTQFTKTNGTGDDLTQYGLAGVDGFVATSVAGSAVSEIAALKSSLSQFENQVGQTFQVVEDDVDSKFEQDGTRFNGILGVSESDTLLHNGKSAKKLVVDILSDASSDRSALRAVEAVASKSSSDITTIQDVLTVVRDDLLQEGSKVNDLQAALGVVDGEHGMGVGIDCVTDGSTFKQGIHEIGGKICALRAEYDSFKVQKDTTDSSHAASIAATQERVTNILGTDQNNLGPFTTGAGIVYGQTDSVKDALQKVGDQASEHNADYQAHKVDSVLRDNALQVGIDSLSNRVTGISGLTSGTTFPAFAALDGTEYISVGKNASQVFDSLVKAVHEGKVSEAQTRTSADANVLASAKQHTNEKIAELTSGADTALDTLKELGDALNNDPNHANTLVQSISTLRTDMVQAIAATGSDAMIARSQGFASEATARSNAIKVETDDRVQGLSLEATARSDAIKVETDARSNALSGEVFARSTALKVETNARTLLSTNEKSARSAAIKVETDARVAALTVEETARSDAIKVESAARSGLSTAEKSAREAAINVESAARSGLSTAEKSARSVAIKVESDARLVAVTAEAVARSTAIDLEAVSRAVLSAAEKVDRSSAVKVETDARVAALVVEAETRALALSAERVFHTNALNLESAVRSDLFVAENSARSAAIKVEADLRTDAIATEASARSEEIRVESAARSGLSTAEKSARSAAIKVESDARSGLSTGEKAARSAAIKLESDDRVAALQEEGSARSVAIKVESDARSALSTAEKSARSVAIDLVADLRAGAEETKRSAAIKLESDDRVAALQEEGSARSVAIKVESDARSTLSTAEKSARSDAIKVESAARSAEEETARSDAIKVESDARVAALTIESVARSDAIKVESAARSAEEETARSDAIKVESDSRVAALTIESVARSDAIKVESDARVAEFDAAINTLTNGASGALDTLKEIGDALNNDADFSGTIITTISGISTDVITRVTAESDARASGIAAEASSRVSALQEEGSARSVAIKVETDARVAALTAEESARSNAIQVESAARVAALAAEGTARSNAIQGETAARVAHATEEETARSNAIQVESDARVAALAAEGTARSEAIKVETAARVAHATEEETARSNAIQVESDARVAALAAEGTARSEAIKVETAARVAHATEEETERSEAIKVESDARVAALAAEGTARSGAINTAIELEISRRDLAIAGEAAKRLSLSTAEKTARSEAIKVETGARVVAVATETVARTAGLSAEGVSRSNAIKVETDARVSALTAESVLRSNAIVVEVGARSDAIIASVNAESILRSTALYAEAVVRSNAIKAEETMRSAGIKAETDARVAAFTAEGSERSSAIKVESDARSVEIAAQISDLSITLSTEVVIRSNAIKVETDARGVSVSTEAATRVAGLAAEGVTRSNAIKVETDARVAAVTAEATNRSTVLSTEVVARSNAIKVETDARADVETAARSALSTNEKSTRSSAIKIETDARVLGITAEANARSTALSGEVVTQATLRSSAIKIETDARVLGITAEANARSTALSGEVVTQATLRSSAIKIETDARGVAVAAEATNRSTALSAEVVARSNAIKVETDARGVAVAAEATNRSTALSAEVVARSVAIQVETDARGVAVTAEATNRSTALSAEVVARSVAIKVETTARGLAITSDRSRMDLLEGATFTNMNIDSTKATINAARTYVGSSADAEGDADNTTYAENVWRDDQVVNATSNLVDNQRIVLTGIREREGSSSPPILDVKDLTSVVGINLKKLTDNSGSGDAGSLVLQSSSSADLSASSGLENVKKLWVAGGMTLTEDNVVLTLDSEQLHSTATGNVMHIAKTAGKSGTKVLVHTSSTSISDVDFSNVAVDLVEFHIGYGDSNAAVTITGTITPPVSGSFKIVLKGDQTHTIPAGALSGQSVERVGGATAGITISGGSSVAGANYRGIATAIPIVFNDDFTFTGHLARGALVHIGDGKIISTAADKISGRTVKAVADGSGVLNVTDLTAAFDGSNISKTGANLLSAFTVDVGSDVTLGAAKLHTATRITVPNNVTLSLGTDGLATFPASGYGSGIETQGANSVVEGGVTKLVAAGKISGPGRTEVTGELRNNQNDNLTNVTTDTFDVSIISNKTALRGNYSTVTTLTVRDNVSVILLVTDLVLPRGDRVSADNTVADLARSVDLSGTSAILTSNCTSISSGIKFTGTGKINFNALEGFPDYDTSKFATTLSSVIFEVSNNGSAITGDLSRVDIIKVKNGMTMILGDVTLPASADGYIEPQSNSAKIQVQADYASNVSGKKITGLVGGTAVVEILGHGSEVIDYTKMTVCNVKVTAKDGSTPQGDFGTAVSEINVAAGHTVNTSGVTTTYPAFDKGEWKVEGTLNASNSSHLHVIKVSGAGELHITNGFSGSAAFDGQYINVGKTLDKCYMTVLDGVTMQGDLANFNKVIVPGTAITDTTVLTLPVYNTTHTGKTPASPIVELSTSSSKLQGNPHKYHLVQITPVSNGQGTVDFTSVTDNTELDLSRIGAAGKGLANISITQSADANTNGIKGDYSKITVFNLSGSTHLKLQKSITLAGSTEFKHLSAGTKLEALAPDAGVSLLSGMTVNGTGTTIINGLKDNVSNDLSSINSDGNHTDVTATIVANMATGLKGDYSTVDNITVADNVTVPIPSSGLTLPTPHGTVGRMVLLGANSTVTADEMSYLDGKRITAASAGLGKIQIFAHANDSDQTYDLEGLGTTTILGECKLTIFDNFTLKANIKNFSSITFAPSAANKTLSLATGTQLPGSSIGEIQALGVNAGTSTVSGEADFFSGKKITGVGKVLATKYVAQDLSSLLNTGTTEVSADGANVTLSGDFSGVDQFSVLDNQNLTISDSATPFTGTTKKFLLKGGASKVIGKALKLHDVKIEADTSGQGVVEVNELATGSAAVDLSNISSNIGSNKVTLASGTVAPLSGSKFDTMDEVVVPSGSILNLVNGASYGSQGTSKIVNSGSVTGSATVASGMEIESVDGTSSTIDLTQYAHNTYFDGTHINANSKATTCKITTASDVWLFSAKGDLSFFSHITLNASVDQKLIIHQSSGGAADSRLILKSDVELATFRAGHEIEANALVDSGNEVTVTNLSGRTVSGSGKVKIVNLQSVGTGAAGAFDTSNFNNTGLTVAEVNASYNNNFAHNLSKVDEIVITPDAVWTLHVDDTLTFPATGKIILQRNSGLSREGKLEGHAVSKASGVIVEGRTHTNVSGPGGTVALTHYTNFDASGFVKDNLNGFSLTATNGGTLSGNIKSVKKLIIPYGTTAAIGNALVLNDGANNVAEIEVQGTLGGKIAKLSGLNVTSSGAGAKALNLTDIPDNTANIDTTTFATSLNTSLAIASGESFSNGIIGDLSNIDSINVADSVTAKFGLTVTLGNSPNKINLGGTSAKVVGTDSSRFHQKKIDGTGIVELTKKVGSSFDGSAIGSDGNLTSYKVFFDTSDTLSGNYTFVDEAVVGDGVVLTGPDSGLTWTTMTVKLNGSSAKYQGKAAVMSGKTITGTGILDVTHLGRNVANSADVVHDSSNVAASVVSKATHTANHVTPNASDFSRFDEVEIPSGVTITFGGSGFTSAKHPAKYTLAAATSSLGSVDSLMHAGNAHQMIVEGSGVLFIGSATGSALDLSSIATDVNTVVFFAPGNNTYTLGANHKLENVDEIRIGTENTIVVGNKSGLTLPTSTMGQVVLSNSNMTLKIHHAKASGMKIFATSGTGGKVEVHGFDASGVFDGSNINTGGHLTTATFIVQESCQINSGSDLTLFDRVDVAAGRTLTIGAANILPASGTGKVLLFGTGAVAGTAAILSGKQIEGSTDSVVTVNDLQNDFAFDSTNFDDNVKATVTYTGTSGATIKGNFSNVMSLVIDKTVQWDSSATPPTGSTAGGTAREITLSGSSAVLNVTAAKISGVRVGQSGSAGAQLIITDAATGVAFSSALFSTSITTRQLTLASGAHALRGDHSKLTKIVASGNIDLTAHSPTIPSAADGEIMLSGTSTITGTTASMHAKKISATGSSTEIILSGLSNGALDTTNFHADATCKVTVAADGTGAVTLSDLSDLTNVDELILGAGNTVTMSSMMANAKRPAKITMSDASGGNAASNLIANCAQLSTQKIIGRAGVITAKAFDGDGLDIAAYDAGSDASKGISAAITVNAEIAAGQGDVSPGAVGNTSNCSAFNKITINGSAGSTSKLILNQYLTLRQGCDIAVAAVGGTANAIVSGDAQTFTKTVPFSYGVSAPKVSGLGTVEVTEFAKSGHLKPDLRMLTAKTITVTVSDAAGISLGSDYFLPGTATIVTVHKDLDITSNFINNVVKKTFNKADGTSPTVTILQTTDHATDISSVAGDANVTINFTKSGILTATRPYSLSNVTGTQAYVIGDATRFFTLASHSHGLALNGSGTGSSVVVTSMQSKLDFDGSEFSGFPNGIRIVFGATGSAGSPTTTTMKLKPKVDNTYGHSKFYVELETGAHVNIGALTGTDADKHETFLQVTRNKDDTAAWTGALANKNQYRPTKKVQFEGDGRLYLFTGASGTFTTSFTRSGPTAGLYTLVMARPTAWNRYDNNTGSNATPGSNEDAAFEFDISQGTIDYQINGFVFSNA